MIKLPGEQWNFAQEICTNISKNKSENFLKGNFSKTLKKFVGKEPDIFTMDLLFYCRKQTHIYMINIFI